MTPSWYSYGTPGMTLIATPDGVRTAFDGRTGAHGTYSRWSTNETWLPPYTFSGRIKVRAKLVPFTIGGQPVTYTTSIVWHIASMPDEPGGANNNNLVVGIGGAGSANVGASAELYRSETGRSAYGVRTGYVSRLREPSPDPVDGEWHTFKAVMLSYDRYQLWWDGTLVADIVEKPPASMRGRLSVGLRLDGFDVELADLDVDDGKEPMGYLTDLADVMRAAGLNVIEVNGWQTRARSGGAPYQPGRPVAVMVHHTASPQRTDGQPDVNYIISGSSVAPISNLYLDRSGVAWVCAGGGPTNTNGAGGPLGTVPKDQMNAHAIGIEIANSGTGEPYPTVQQDAAAKMVRALCNRYGITQVFSHFEWAPGRKVDPAGPSRWSPQGGKWNMDAFRAEVSATTPPTKPKKVAMFRIRYRDASYAPNAYTGLISNGPQLGWISDGNGDIALGKGGAEIVDDLTPLELDGLIATSQTTSDPPPEFSTARKAAWNARRG